MSAAGPFRSTMTSPVALICNSKSIFSSLSSCHCNMPLLSSITCTPSLFHFLLVVCRLVVIAFLLVGISSTHLKMDAWLQGVSEEEQPFG